MSAFVRNQPRCLPEWLRHSASPPVTYEAPADGVAGLDRAVRSVDVSRSLNDLLSSEWKCHKCFSVSLPAVGRA